jgi:hypothetical protein
MTTLLNVSGAVIITSQYLIYNPICLIGDFKRNFAVFLREVRKSFRGRVFTKKIILYKKQPNGHSAYVMEWHLHRQEKQSSYSRYLNLSARAEPNS